MKQGIALLGISTLLTISASAIEFDLLDASIESIDESSSMDVLVDGITATLTAGVSGSSGVLNGTSSSFGVNAFGGADETSRMDGGGGAETVFITFSAPVQWTGLVLSLLSSGETGSLTLPQAGSLTLKDTGNGTDLFAYSADNVVLLGETVEVGWASGNGFSFNSFSVEPYDIPSDEPGGNGETPVTNRVPDSGSTLMMLVGAAAMLSVRTIRNRLASAY